MSNQSESRSLPLTREQIEIMRGLWISESDAVSAKYKPVILEEVRRQANALCDMALASLSERGTPKEDYRKCFTALVTLLPMAKAAIPHPSCTVAYAASLAQADQAIYEALHPEAPK